jgi:hypothetical protein
MEDIKMRKAVKLDSGVSTSAREKAWEIISQPFSC